MKLRIEVIDDLREDEVIIRCGRVNETVQKVQQYILEQTSRSSGITFYKGNQEYWFPLDDVLFFETDGEHVYAHSAEDAYRTKLKLYELEAVLPRHFARAAKSTIINLRHLYSIERNITSSSLVRFKASHKQVFVSRSYYNELRRRINERGITNNEK